MITIAETWVPSWVAVALAVATLSLFAAVVLLLLRSKRARVAQDNPTSKDAKVLRRLFVAALIPSLLVIAAVMAISFVGLSSFAQDDMGFIGFASLIVPLTLDGISITFGFWSFVAVKRGRDPQHSNRIVYAGALISAWINYQHGSATWTGIAGVYLGFLSLASAWMFHELLSQFMDGQEQAPKARRHGIPAFGERWMWAPWSTLLARRAWVVHPPADSIESTPANALAHLTEVRTRRALERDTRGIRHKAAVAAVNRQLTASGQPTEQVPAVTARDDQATYVPSSPSPNSVPANVSGSAPARPGPRP